MLWYYAHKKNQRIYFAEFVETYFMKTKKYNSVYAKHYTFEQWGRISRA